MERGAKVVGYDPVANQNFLMAVPEVMLSKSAKEALRGAHGCIIQADWPEFRKLDAEDFSVMAKQVVVDGRRTLDRKGLGDRVIYRRIG
jgi:UDPglucose 6-dehydrogenase